MSKEVEATDNLANRAGWFAEALDHIGNYWLEAEPRSIAFPMNIGCGAAGGRWHQRKLADDSYFTMLQKFVRRKPKWIIVAYKFMASTEFDAYEIDATMNRGNDEFHEAYRKISNECPPWRNR